MEGVLDEEPRIRRQLEQKLNQLKKEFEHGQSMLADIDAKQTNLRATLLRISGAIQVIEELLAEPSRDQVSIEEKIAVHSQ